MMLPDEYVQDLASQFGLPDGDLILNFARSLIAEYDATDSEISHAEKLADDLYCAGYEAGIRERDYDPRAGLEWQEVVDAIRPKRALSITFLADAERYQWIRSVGVRGITGSQLDNAIDMAMAEGGTQ